MNHTPKLQFMACLDLPDLTRLNNNTIWHNPTWPTKSTKLPSKIQQFELHTRETHVTTSCPFTYGVPQTTSLMFFYGYAFLNALLLELLENGILSKSHRHIPNLHQ
jgi:hypothetical protein